MEAPGAAWLVLGVPADGHRARRGVCWRCDATDRPVAWIGAVRLDGEAAPFTACRPCAERIGHLAREHAR
jgi:hypothetical protein